MSSCNSACSIILDQPPVRFVMAGGRNARVQEDPPPAPAPAAPPPPDLESIKREAFAAGEASGRAAMDQLAAAQREFFARLEKDIDAYQDNLERAVFEQAIDLSVRIAETILRRMLPDAEMLRGMLREILERITDLERIHVRVHPQDAGPLRQGLEDGEFGAGGRIEIVIDSALMPGDLVVENGFGCFDARLPQRLQLLRDELTERWRKTDADTTENKA